MGNPNQRLFIQQRLRRLSGPFLEIGSRDYGSTEDLRSLFKDRGEYLGVDLEPGKGVDVVADLTRPFEEVDTVLAGRRFGTVFCLSVLEHCWRPFALAENTTRLLRPGGSVCVSCPFAFKYHAFPGDYWRFTHEGVRVLFPDLDFADADAAWYTPVQGDFHPVGADLGRIDLRAKRLFHQGKPFRAVLCGGARTAGRLVGLHRLIPHAYVLAPTDLIMLGTLPG